MAPVASPYPQLVNPISRTKKSEKAGEREKGNEAGVAGKREGGNLHPQRHQQKFDNPCIRRIE